MSAVLYPWCNIIPHFLQTCTHHLREIKRIIACYTNYFNVYNTLYFFNMTICVCFACVFFAFVCFYFSIHLYDHCPSFSLPMNLIQLQT